MSLNSEPALRILVIAEACNPTWTSVPLVGYNFVRALAERSDLQITVATHIRNRAAILGDPLIQLAKVHFIDNEWLARPLYRLSTLIRGGEGLSWTINTAMGWPSYIVFEQSVHRLFGGALRSNEFDLIHRITPLTPTMGSPLAELTHVPMIAGPLNGGLPWPKEYPSLRSQEKEWLAPFRGLYKCLPYYRSTYRRLAAVISGSRHTATEVPNSFVGKRYYMVENGVNPGRLSAAARWPEPNGRFRFLTVGRLVPYKGFDLVLEAMKSSTVLRDCELRIVGDGPYRTHLEGLVRHLSLEKNVVFTGWVDQQKIIDEFSIAQTFVFPSLREFGGAVIVEAMATGLPTIVVDYGGPAELVTPDCGLLLPMQPRERLVPALAAAMERLVNDPARCREMSAAAVARTRNEFAWPAKAAKLVEIYRDVLAARNGQLISS